MSPKSARLYRTDAVVLKAYPYGEADRILTLLTPQFGKLRAIAKGVRRTKSRMSGHVDLLTHTSLLVARGRQLDVVTQAETVESFAPLRSDLTRISLARYVSELADGFSAEQLANEPLYSLTLRTLRALATSTQVDMVVRAFEVQMLGVTGYRPQLHRCLHCGDTIRPGANTLSARMGGILCPNCGGVDAAAAPVTDACLKIMRNLQTNPQAVLALHGVGTEAEREVERRLQDYLLYRLEHRPRSWAFLERLRAEYVSPGESL